MIELKQSLMWDGFMVPAGTKITLPPALERLVVAAGNGEYLDVAERNRAEIDLHPDIPDLVKRIEALKLDLPDGLTYEQVKEAVEKAEQEQKNAEPDGIPPTDDPELKLGRTGSAQ